MALPNVFSPAITDELIGRLNNLNAQAQPNWGKMDAAQMLAHCNVTYEMLFEDKHPKPNAFVKFMLKLFVKGKVVSEAPYEQNSRTAPQFIISSSKDYEQEKQRLIGYLKRTQELGSAHFEGKTSHSFGPLTVSEWNNMLYKHLDHHFTQFGV